MKNNILAIPTAAAAMPKKPNAAAMSATIKKTMAQFNIVPPFIGSVGVPARFTTRVHSDGSILQGFAFREHTRNAVIPHDIFGRELSKETLFGFVLQGISEARN